MKITLLITSLLLSGCALLGREGNGTKPCSDQDRSIASAVRLYDRGNEKEAVRCLQELVAERKEGTTDEALFRLGLMHLKQLDKDEIEQSQKRLEELQRDYPKSPWAAMAAPVMVFLKDSLRQTRDLKMVNQSLIKENRELSVVKGHNATLIKENRELRQTIEKLKHLDLELENKPRKY